MSLTPEQIEQATQIRLSGATWREVSAAIGETLYQTRTAIDPGFHDRMIEDQRRRREGLTSLAEIRNVDSRPERIPLEVLRDQERVRSYEPATPTAFYCGDPPPWRSALAQRRAT